MKTKIKKSLCEWITEKNKNSARNLHVTSAACDVHHDGTVPVLAIDTLEQRLGSTEPLTTPEHDRLDTAVDISKCFLVVLCVWTVHAAFMRGFVDIVSAHCAKRARSSVDFLKISLTDCSCLVLHKVDVNWIHDT